MLTLSEAARRKSRETFFSQALISVAAAGAYHTLFRSNDFPLIRGDRCRFDCSHPLLRLSYLSYGMNKNVPATSVKTTIAGIKNGQTGCRFPRACPDGRSPAFLDHPYPHFRPSAYVSSWCFHRSQDANLRNTSAATARPLSVKTTAVFTRYPRLMVTSRSPAALFSARWPIDRMYLNAAKRVMFNSLAYHPTGWPSLSTTPIGRPPQTTEGLVGRANR